MPTVDSPLTDASIRASHERKEAGFVAHLLRGVAAGLPKVAALAVGLGATLWVAGGQGVDVPTTGYAVAGAVVAAATIAFEVVQSRIRNRQDVSTYDAPAVHDLVKRLETRAKGSFSARRGTTWIVVEPDSRSPRVLDAREYAEHKRNLAAAGLPLDEVTVERDAVTVRRLVGGRLDPGARALPAVETYDVVLGKAKAVGWFSKGAPSDEATIARRVDRSHVRPEFSATDFLRSELPRHDEDALPAPGM